LLEQVANTIDQHAVHLESLQEADPQQLAKFLESSIRKPSLSSWRT